MIFGLKAGLAIGGALVAGLLSFYGYDPLLHIQSDQAIQGILMTMSVYPAITFFMAVAALFFYEINKEKEVMIERELGSRRNAKKK